MNNIMALSLQVQISHRQNRTAINMGCGLALIRKQKLTHSITHPSSSRNFSLYISLQQKMECVSAKALKSSFLSSHEASFDDLWCVAGVNTVVNVSSDEFSVDDLFDFSDKDFANSDSFEESSVASSQDNDTQFSSSGDLMSLTAEHLSVSVIITAITSILRILQIDDMESLEWLSKIVDDSMPELPIFSPAVKLNDSTGMVVNRFEPVVNLSSHSFTVLGLPYPVPRKCRTEPKRKPGRLWSAGSLTESSSSSSSYHDSSVTSPMLFRIPFYSTTVFEKKPVAKKRRKNPASQNRLGSSESPSQRRCTHCQVQKTPQWRTGPLGPKTLCNACGVRFKSGRLYPEYRPACSPTFSGDVHSNSHRRVLELRKKEKGVEPVLNMAVQ
ncbi:hypothetical protein QVD17_03684 [Tagetes erecta]|uniref:GATA-type domain-containing protein n=1 Tax=Tagetes erecta TaxID=13708 RepID=A0AAD8P9X0_TARER|nr:hypothetical protein QVD17_03684 [Tagetes erecta]